MEIRKEATTGTLESSDVLIRIAPNPENEIEIRLESVVKTTFGQKIEATVREVLRDMGVTGAIVELTDKGAIDCVIRARVEAAVCRASETKFNWEGESVHG